MKCTVTDNNFYNSIKMALQAIDNKHSIPILKNLLIEMKGDNIYLKATDLDWGIIVKVPAIISSEGSTTVPGKLFLAIMKELKYQPIEFENIEFENGEHLFTINYKKYQARLITLPSDDFPKFPNTDKNTNDFISLQANTLVNALKQTIFVGDVRCGDYRFKSVKFDIIDGRINLISTDGHRLAIKGIRKTGIKKKQESPIINTTSLKKIINVLKELKHESVNIILNNKWLIIKHGNVKMFFRCLETKYPNYNQLLDMGFKSKFEINKSMFLKSMNRLRKLKGHSAKISLKKNKYIELFCSDSYEIHAHEILKTPFTGENLENRYNLYYLIQGIKKANGENICIKLGKNKTPLFMKSGSFRYWVMPVSND